MVRPALRRLLAAGALLLAALLAAATLAPAAQAATGASGWVRAAHLSPDTPQVDVYLSSFGRTDPPTVLPGVGYGAISPYMKVPAGSYTVAMRGAGAPATSPPVLETTVQVGAGTANTVAGVGRNAELKLVAYADDLTPPPDGQSKVRIVQAALTAPQVDVVELGATPVARGLAFTATTEYVTVAAGATQVKVGSGATTAQRSLDLRAGSTYTVVVRDVSTGLDVFAIQDAAASQVVPNGGVDAGAGALADPPADRAPWLLAGTAALLGVALVTVLPKGRGARRQDRG